MKTFESGANRRVHLSTHSRIVLFVLRRVVRPLLGFIMGGGNRRIAWLRTLLAARHNAMSRSSKARYEYVGKPGNEVPGRVLGELDPANGPVLLWLHGGAWFMPIIPENHLATVERLRQGIGGSAFVPDYRLLPGNPFPASLDDCAVAYEALLGLGFKAEQIAVAGDSAGGNMSFALLHRIRARKLPMPACAVGVAPATDMSRFGHGLPSHVENAARDAVLPTHHLLDIVDQYCGEHSRILPEISPLYGDLSGFPPTYLVCSEVEILRDDSVMLANRMQAVGCEVKLDIWADLPHIFPLCEDLLPEARQSREDIETFLREHLRQ